MKVKAIKEINSTPIEAKSRVIGVALKQEDNESVLVVLTDEDGREIKDSAILRIVEDHGENKDKIYVARIVYRHALKDYITVTDDRGQIRMS